MQTVALAVLLLGSAGPAPAQTDSACSAIDTGSGDQQFRIQLEDRAGPPSFPAFAYRFDWTGGLPALRAATGDLFEFLAANDRGVVFLSLALTVPQICSGADHLMLSEPLNRLLDGPEAGLAATARPVEYGLIVEGLAEVVLSSMGSSPLFHQLNILDMTAGIRWALVNSRGRR